MYNTDRVSVILYDRYCNTRTLCIYEYMYSTLYSTVNILYMYCTVHVYHVNRNRLSIYLYRIV